MRQLREMGAEVQAVTHRGYRLAAPTQALDGARIRELAGSRAAAASIEVAWTLDSTNLSLLARAAPPAGQVDVLFAEHQAAGRGRRGRRWLAPLGAGLCVSFATSFSELPPDVSALSLAIGVCVLRALRSLGLQPAQLKWPNDIVTPQGKLGGVLIELRAESGGPAQIVVGIGLNLRLDATTAGELRAEGAPAADLQSLGGDPAARNATAAALVAECTAGLQQFAGAGFAAFIDEWRAADALRGRAVSVSGAGATQTGIARGIDARGAFLLDVGGSIQPVIAGEVSVRAQS